MTNFRTEKALLTYLGGGFVHVLYQYGERVLGRGMGVERDFLSDLVSVRGYI